jgi:hypothetical protein
MVRKNFLSLAVINSHRKVRIPDYYARYAEGVEDGTMAWSSNKETDPEQEPNI